MVSIRTATVADAMAIAGVHVRSWQVGYRDLLPSEVLDQLNPAVRAARYDFGDGSDRRTVALVAVDGAAIRGFAAVSPSRDADTNGFGEVQAIYVNPDHWGSGIGRQLMAAARERLSDAGFSKAILWMLAGNTRAARFYEADGWSPDGATRTEVTWGVEVAELRYRRPFT